MKVSVVRRYESKLGTPVLLRKQALAVKNAPLEVVLLRAPIASIVRAHALEHSTMRRLSSPWYPSLLVLLALRATSTLAHAGLPETSNVTVRREHPEDLMVGATFGAVVSRDEGRSWRWICPEAMARFGWRAGSFLWRSEGQMLVATGTLLLRSSDSGCSWQAHPFFGEAGLWPSHLTSHPAEPTRLWVVTGRPNTPNGLYRSDDGGETFTTTALLRTDATFNAVEVAPSDTRRLYVSGQTPDGPRVFRSSDAGETWEELPPLTLELILPYGLQLMRVAENDADHLWAHISSQGSTYVLESRDGGHTFQSVLTLDESLINAESSADGRTLWVATITRLLRSRDGAPATPLALPEGNACVQREGDVLYACGSTWVHDWALARSRDEGGTWEPLLSLPDIQGVHACPAGTPTHDVCGPRWPQLTQLLGIALDAGTPAPVPDAGTSEPAPDAGTPGGVKKPLPPSKPRGCSATGMGGLAAAWALAFAVLRRSRRRGLDT